jgi:serine/threonine protein kinase/tetratricopeptide (TPR) repeat protein
MTKGSSDQTRPIPLTREAAVTLAAQLVAEMIRRWRQGERPLPEEFLARHPELWEHPEAAADLIYEELCLRQECGTETPLDEVLHRFPQWRPQLEVLFDCQRLLGPGRAAPQFPAVGESLGDFVLLAELGGGAQGLVFLASQLSLGDRPVVLKVTPSDANEHLALARLQHTHIVPLYSVQEHPTRGLRTLCMPYFGGATLDQLFEALQSQPPARRTGQELLDALDRASHGLRIANCEWQNANCKLQIGNPPGPARQFLARASYVQAVCFIGACLADALEYAHERGLVHLDLKPSNVLLAADGQPMVLDFHLARGPIHPDGETPQWLGGTAGYMSPEQETAVRAVQLGRKAPLPVDGRSDIYSLGVVLYEALAGRLPEADLSPASPSLGKRADRGRGLHPCNAEVSVGLADLVGKCLAVDSADRYPHMAAVAADLRRHLADLPLQGVRNRNLAERWRKWRRRRPHGVALAGMMLAVLTAAGAVALGTVSHFSQRIAEARTALTDGQAQLARGEWEGAIRTLEWGRSAARGIPFHRDLADELNRELDLAQQRRTAVQRAAAARELHQLAACVRFLYGADPFPLQGLDGLASSCSTFWEDRGRIAKRLTPAGASTLQPAVRDDLLDLAIFWADLQVRLAPATGKGEARRKALTVLNQAEALFGPSPVLDAERKIQGAPGRSPRTAPQTAWEHYALGRSLLRSGDLQRAAEEVGRAVLLQPQGLWPNFYQGLCAYRRGQYADAVMAYSVCIGAAPEAAVCFYNRALALDALGRTGQAQHDYDQALRLDPTLAGAALNRAMLHYRARRYAAALGDLERAQKLGADPAIVSFDLALVYLARGEQDVALDKLRRSLSYNPHQPDARKLLDRLLDRAPGSSSARPPQKH